MSTDSETFAQIMARRQRQAREREEQVKRWSQEVTEQLHNQRSKFLEDFTENERRIFATPNEQETNDGDHG